MISHDVGLLEQTVNKVFHLDANRAELDIYAMGWRRYLQQRETDEKRRKRERQNAERKADQLMTQADKMRAKATKATAAQNMARRAERLLAGIEAERASDRVAKIRFPEPAPCGKTPLTADDLSKSYGSLEVFTGVDLAIDRGSQVVVLGLNGAGKTTLLRILAGLEEPDTGGVLPGHGLRLGYYAQEHETLDVGRSVLANMRTAAPDLNDTDVRKVLGSFLFSGDDVEKPAGVLVRRGEDPAGAGDAGGLQRQRAAAGRADQQPRPGVPGRGAGGDPALRGRGRAGDPRRGRGGGPGPGPGAAAARRHRGPLEPGLRRPGRARLKINCCESVNLRMPLLIIYRELG